jgi:hypothetical protein
MDRNNVAGDLLGGAETRVQGQQQCFVLVVGGVETRVQGQQQCFVLVIGGAGGGFRGNSSVLCWW